MNELYSLARGDAPLIVSMPHLGTEIPDELRDGYTDAALAIADTDWHLDHLYSFAQELGATILGARVSRYVIDLNRPPSDKSLYPGQTTTGLCPTETFRGEPIYRFGHEPDAAEKERRVTTFWRPYHDALQGELARLRKRYPHVLLWEAHSIASVLPRLFEGKLPDLNLGTQDGRTAAHSVLEPVVAAAHGSQFTWVTNGRFKGGYITRHYGAPEHGIHSVQLEMAQSVYMNENSPFEYRDQGARTVVPVLQRMLNDALQALKKLPEAQTPPY